VRSTSLLLLFRFYARLLRLQRLLFSLLLPLLSQQTADEHATTSTGTYAEVVRAAAAAPAEPFEVFSGTSLEKVNASFKRKHDGEPATPEDDHLDATQRWAENPAAQAAAAAAAAVTAAAAEAVAATTATTTAVAGTTATTTAVGGSGECAKKRRVQTAEQLEEERELEELVCYIKSDEPPAKAVANIARPEIFPAAAPHAPAAAAGPLAEVLQQHGGEGDDEMDHDAAAPRYDSLGNGAATAVEAAAAAAEAAGSGAAAAAPRGWGHTAVESSLPV
jgi:hypothetical protein